MFTRQIKHAALLPLAAALLCSAPSALAGTNGKIVLKVGRIVTQAGPDIVNGTIVIENGKITAIGADVKGSWDAEVFDHPELTAFPGYVEAHSNRGMDRPNENIEVAPFLDVKDSIDPISFYFEDSLRATTTLVFSHNLGRKLSPFATSAREFRFE